MTEAVAVPQELEAKSTSLTVQAKDLPAIRTPDDYRHTCDLGRALKSMSDGISEFWEAKISSAYQTHKMLVKAKKDMLLPVDEAIERVKSAISTFDQAQEKARAEAERAYAAELKRLADEEAMQTASALQEAGDAAGAQQVIEQAIAAPPPPVIMPKMVPKVAGVSTRENWKFRITDPEKVPDEYWVIDEQRLGQVARALKGSAKIPGVQVYNESAVSFRG